MSESAERTLTVGIAGGLALVLIGVAAYILTDFASVTALIPVLFGLMIAVIGYTGRRPDRHRRSIVSTGLLALLVVFGSVMGLPDLLDWLAGESVDAPVAAVAQGLSTVVGLVIVAATAVHARHYV